ncbi:MAG: hypothetical protein HC834_06830 [Rhodospirillales bacterium]|nr:hypothetical protein [Rhodospirillales bacterium]
MLRMEGRGPVRGPAGPIDVRVIGEEWFAPELGMIRASFLEEVQGRPENAVRVDLDLIESQRSPQ